MRYEDVVKNILDIPLFAQKIGIDNLKVIMERLGNPQDSYRCIHVAGTNGKGSTCAYMNSLLIASEYKVGMFTSPHLIKLNERMRINNLCISDMELIEVYELVENTCRELMLEGVPHPSFFEFIFAMAAVWFKLKKVDIVIFETGMGGRLDATNIINSDLCVITSVAMDHMQYLGNTIEQIASEKAGIIKEKVPIVYFNRNKQVSSIIEERAKFCKAPLFVVDKGNYMTYDIGDKNIDFSIYTSYYRYDSLSLKKTGMYQVENAALAVIATDIFLDRCIEDNLVREALMDCIWTARMEEVADDIYVDGAHNEEAIEAFTDTVSVLYNDKDVYILFAVASDKEYDSMVKLLCTRIDIKEVIITAIEGGRTTPVEKVAELFKKYRCNNIKTDNDIESSYLYASSLVDEHSRLFCVGSLYLAGKLESLLRRK